MAEVEKAIKGKQGKTASPDEIKAEKIKLLSNFSIDTITEICIEDWIHPQESENIYFHLRPKETKRC